jgi:hypothetical protein
MGLAGLPGATMECLNDDFVWTLDVTKSKSLVVAITKSPNHKIQKFQNPYHFIHTCFT